ncbi:MAG: Xaa-Pro peptidase family protein [Vicinamibacteria bacterium]|nr:Xaa-Pro peptidase family protein [Vicinamibacteria bacterium]
MARKLDTALVLLMASSPAAAQQGFTDAFPPEEFAARRERVIAQIGDAVAILPGTTERRGESPLRQSNQFFYLTGVTEPRALLIIDGKARRTTLFLSPATPRRERAIGPYLDVNEASRKATGVDVIEPRESFTTAVAKIAADKRTIFAPMKPEVLGSESASDVVAFMRATKEDPWDGHVGRDETFLARLKTAAPDSEIKDLDPILDTLRAVKSPREIAIIREATRLAGLGIMEVMRDAEPGMFEYELEAAAEYVYKRGGAYGESYFPLIANGRNMPYTHYHKNRDRLRAGDLVQFDWAPDIANYTSDVTRVFPANGKFTPRQREFYLIYLRLYQALMTSIRVHATAREIMDAAVLKMDRIMVEYKFTDPKIRETAEAFVNRYRVSPNAPAGGPRSLGHSVGMEVHDVRNPTATLEPGYIFTIEPQMTMEGGELSVRLEDMILITGKGYENMSAFVPVEPEEIEKLMTQPGLGTHTLKLPPGFGESTSRERK